MPKYTPAVYDDVNPQFIALPTGSTVDPSSIPEFESKNKSYFHSNGFSGNFSIASAINFNSGIVFMSPDITLTTNNTINLPANKKYCVDALINLNLLGSGATFLLKGTNLIINTTQSRTLAGAGNVFLSGMLLSDINPATLQLMVSNIGGSSITITNQSSLRIFEI